jgi:hypothetical protein
MASSSSATAVGSELLYLNPEWAAYSNARTPAAALALYSNLPSPYTGGRLSELPSNFHAPTFLCLNGTRLGLGISRVQAAISNASPSLTSPDPSPPLPTIQGLVRCLGPTQLRLLDVAGPPLGAPSNWTQAGDVLRLYDNGNYVLDFRAQVQSAGAQDINLVTPARPSLISGSDYILWGHQLTDPLRCARVNFLRIPQAERSNWLYQYDDSFNYPLYRMLYPDALRLDRDAAYIDLVSRARRDDFRIGKAEDLVFANDFNQFSVQSLRVLDGGLTVDGPLYMSGGDVVVVGFSDDSERPAGEASAQLLITERAAKAFSANAFADLFEDPTFENPVAMLQGADVQGLLSVQSLRLQVGPDQIGVSDDGTTTPGASNLLITERASKSFSKKTLDDFLADPSLSNADVTGTTSVSGLLRLTGPLQTTSSVQLATGPVLVGTSDDSNTFPGASNLLITERASKAFVRNIWDDFLGDPSLSNAELTGTTSVTGPLHTTSSVQLATGPVLVGTSDDSNTFPGASNLLITERAAKAFVRNIWDDFLGDPSLSNAELTGTTSVTGPLHMTSSVQLATGPVLVGTSDDSNTFPGASNLLITERAAKAFAKNTLDDFLSDPSLCNAELTGTTSLTGVCLFASNVDIAGVISLGDVPEIVSERPVVVQGGALVPSIGILRQPWGV